MHTVTGPLLFWIVDTKVYNVSENWETAASCHVLDESDGDMDGHDGLDLDNGIRTLELLVNDQRKREETRTRERSEDKYTRVKMD